MESKEGEGKSSSSSSEVTTLPLGNLYPNSKITGELFNGRNYSEWSYSAELALGGTPRLGYVDGSKSEVPKDDHKYAEWKEKNMLIMSWIYNSMELFRGAFVIVRLQKEIWDSIKNSYALKRNHARIYKLKRELANLKQGEMSLGDYYAQIQGLWRELELYQPILVAKKRMLKIDAFMSHRVVLTQSMTQF